MQNSTLSTTLVYLHVRRPHLEAVISPLDLLPVSQLPRITLPDELSELTLAHPAEVYGLLFRAAAETLLEVGGDPRHLGARLGFWLVLHTWGQQLQHHPHVHAVVPGGGLSQGEVTFQWKDSRSGSSDTELTLPGAEFVRRFVQHILPRGFPRVRSYGLLANRTRAAHLTRCRELLGVRTEPPSPAAGSAAESAECSPPDGDVPDGETPLDDDDTPPHRRCPACDSRAWHEIAATPRPAWWQIPPLTSDSHFHLRTPPTVRSRAPPLHLPPPSQPRSLF